jgi:hypothetical protein
MFDRTLVTSGFDVEVLISEDYFTYLLLAQVEAGILPLQTTFVDPGSGHAIEITIHPPSDYVRRYPPHPDAPLPQDVSGSLGVRLLAEGDVAFLFLLAWVTVTDTTAGTSQGPAPAGMNFDLELEPGRVSEEGFESGHVLKLAFVGFDGTTAAILGEAGIDVAAVEDAVRGLLPSNTPLGVAQGQQVHQIRLRKFVSGDQRSLGLYVNLALKSDPETYVEARGDVADAQDFRPLGAPMAFATSPGLFALLGPDAKARQAELNKDGDGYRFPLREDPLDPDSDEIGRIKGISVGAEIVPGNPQATTGRLLVDVHGEYTDAPGDPDFHLQLFFNPKADNEGLVTWDLDVDVDLGLLATLLLIAVGIGLTLLFGPGLGWGSTLLIGSVLGVAVLKGLIAEPLAARIVSDRLDSETQASFLDVLPFQLPGARRRWDPFYTTEHLVVALVDERVVVDRDGIAFVAAHLALDKKPVPVDHVVIRDEERRNGSVSALRYRVSDFNRITADLEALAPGTDRLDYARSDPAGEPTLVSLTPDQLAERIPEKKLLAPLTYTAERIHLVEGQIEHILALSSREPGELSDAIIRDFRARMRAFIVAEFGDAIREQVTQQLEEDLGMPPTQEQITDAFNAHVNLVIDGLIPGFKSQLLPGLLRAAVARTLRFDLRPEELIAQQQAGVLVLDGVEIIVRHNANGTVTPYYRDHPDADPRDNLLAKRHYTPPYVPPP